MDQKAKAAASVNNAFYDELQGLWESGSDHPIALLRAENRTRNPWILSVLEKGFRSNSLRFLDMGCGGGLLTNFLSSKGLENVEGVDLSSGSLMQAKQADATGRVIYHQANAMCLPHKNSSFDAVAAMDILEHVEYPADLVREAARVLRPDGLFFFHTFNRNFFSWLTAIKSLEWFVKNTPRGIHVYRLFLRPSELCVILEDCGLEVVEMRGLKPVLWQRPLLQMLTMREIDPNFRFRFSRSLLTGYCGYARKKKG